MQPLRRACIVSVVILMTDILLDIHVPLLAKVTHRKHVVDLVPMMSGKLVSTGVVLASAPLIIYFVR